MAVVNLKSSLFRADDTNKPLDPIDKAGRLIVMTGTVANAASDSNLSSYHLCDLPSDCMLHELTAFDVENWGFATVNIGTKTDIDALVTVAKSAGNTVKPVAFGDAGHGKRLWEILGLAADPGGVIGLYLHASANATGAGSCPFQVVYLAR
ncbi:hypothetical protein SAMN04244548_03002 [Paracoccus pantotrophus]|nr:hypothetical protein SAMN04244548_03002 [Paracoccus pantotrophus]